jgi:hypothetical protein
VIQKEKEEHRKKLLNLLESDDEIDETVLTVLPELEMKVEKD